MDFASEAIERPKEYQVKFTLRRIFKHLVQLFPLAPPFATAFVVLILFDYFIAHLLTPTLEFPDLVIYVLFVFG